MCGEGVRVEEEERGSLRFQSACSRGVALARAPRPPTASQFKPLFGPFFRATCLPGELSGLFFCMGAAAGGQGESYTSRATADKSANPQTWPLVRKMLRAGN